MTADRSRTLLVVALALLGVYTLGLFALSFVWPVEKIRYFFTDLAGPVELSHLTFYGINTSLAVFFLWATALLFAVRLFMLGTPDEPPARRWFFLSQILLFAFLGTDDRFQFHETIEEVWGIHEIVTLGVPALAELALLAGPGREQIMRRPVLIPLTLGGAFYALMIGVDQLIDSEAAWRLATEDLAKTWSAFFLSAFAWSVCRQSPRLADRA
ncbi:hypothetical protein K8I61_07305 [bacterium]|nr:hypothetical protein [bacterium]